MADSIVQIETLSGVPIQVGSQTITVHSQVLQIKLPRFTGGVIWNRPTSVVVRTKEGHEEVLPIRDVTRLIQMIVFGLGLLSTLMLSRKR